MSTANVILDHLNELSPEAMVIANHDVNQKHANVVWKSMVEQAEDLIGYRTASAGDPVDQADYYNERMRTFEEEILAIRAANGERVKKKNGEWLYSKVSHNSSYRSNKSVIGKAIGAGLDLSELGEPVPKSKLEKAAREATKVDVPAIERAQAYVTKLKNVWSELDGQDRGELAKQLRDLVNEV